MLNPKIQTSTILKIVLIISCVLIKPVQAKYQSQSSLTIEEAKAKLEQLQVQLLRVERIARDELEGMIAQQVNTAPKSEFETTKQYEARNAKANELRQQIEEGINRKKEERRGDR